MVSITMSDTRSRGIPLEQVDPLERATADARHSSFPAGGPLACGRGGHLPDGPALGQRQLVAEFSFTNLLLVTAAAFVAPLGLGLLPRVKLPAVVVEILLGIVLGPSGLGWARSDPPVQILALVGLAFLLFLAGLEVDLERLRRKLLQLAALGFVLSVALALSVGYALRAAGQIHDPLFVAIVLSATALGLVVPVLKDAGHSESEFGQLVLGSATFADFGTVILLSLFFSGKATGIGARLALLGSF